MPAITAAREILAEGRYLSLIREGTWEYAARNAALGAVVIVPVTPAGELVLVEQHRIPVASPVIELPAGLVGDVAGEPTDDWGLQARRELLEETGFAAQRVRRLAEGPVSAGFGSERVEFWLATGLTREHAGGGVEHEQIRVHVVRLPQVPAWLERQRRRGCLVDLRVYAGLWFAERVVQGRTQRASGNRQRPVGQRTAVDRQSGRRPAGGGSGSGTEKKTGRVKVGRAKPGGAKTGRAGAGGTGPRGRGRRTSQSQ